MPRRLAVSPVPAHRADARHPVDLPAAVEAVENETRELPLELAFYPEELDADHLHGDSDRVGTVESGVHRVSDDGVHLLWLIGDGSRRALKDVTIGAHVDSRRS